MAKVESLLYKHEDLSLKPPPPRKKLGTAV